MRALRAVAASALTTLLAATAHTLGDGGAPAPTVLLIAMLLSMPVALVFTGRGAGRVRTALAVFGAQTVYHLVFAVFGMSAAFAGPVAHVHGSMAAAESSTGAAPMAAAAPMMGLLEPWMLAMHAASAIAAIALLRHGERLVRAVVAMIWPALLRRVFRPLVPRGVRPLVDGRPTPVVHTLLSGVRGRAPPVAL